MEQQNKAGLAFYIGLYYHRNKLMLTFKGGFTFDDVTVLLLQYGGNAKSSVIARPDLPSRQGARSAPPAGY